jgi:hypothetical protein
VGPLCPAMSVALYDGVFPSCGDTPGTTFGVLRLAWTPLAGGVWTTPLLGARRQFGVRASMRIMRNRAYIPIHDAPSAKSDAKRASGSKVTAF